MSKNTQNKIFKTGVSFLVLIIFVFALLFFSGVITNKRMIEPGNVKGKNHKISENADLFKLEEHEVPQYYRAVGTVQSRDDIELTGRITARILDIKVDSGDSVKKNELLVRLDDEDLQSDVDKARENLKNAQAVLRLAEKEMKRAETLMKKDAISGQLYDKAQQDFESATAGVEAAKKSLKLTETRLSYAYIKAPMNGTVSDVLSDVGDMASPGKVLMSIFSPERLMLYVPVKESLIEKIKIGQEMTFSVSAMNKDYTGEVKEIVQAVDPGSRTFMTRICIGNSDKLMPGMFGSIKIPTGKKKVLLLPESAMIFIGQLEYVYLKRKNGEIIKTHVRTIPAEKKAMLELVSGLKAGDEILVQTK